jgi:hypothetical protein
MCKLLLYTVTRFDGYCNVHQYLQPKAFRRDLKIDFFVKMFEIADYLKNKGPDCYGTCIECGNRVF